MEKTHRNTYRTICGANNNDIIIVDCCFIKSDIQNDIIENAKYQMEILSNHL